MKFCKACSQTVTACIHVNFKFSNLLGKHSDPAVKALQIQHGKLAALQILLHNENIFDISAENFASGFNTEPVFVRKSSDMKIKAEAIASAAEENGADVMVAGSAYFGAKDRSAFVKLIQA